MNILKPERKLAILSGLLEGCSARSGSRMTGAHLETVLKVLVETGTHCERLLDEKIRGLQLEAVELDEIWSFVYKKQRKLTKMDKAMNPEYGDAYTYTALDPASKLLVCFLVGKRDAPNTEQFVSDLSKRINGEIQLSTDGWSPYVPSIQRSFGNRATHAELIKVYASESPGSGRYTPPKVIGTRINERLGVPNRSKVGTSYVERMNWTIRCSVRRYTRLTNGFSRKVENLRAAIALWFGYYNFCRIHGTIKVTPAMEAGLTEKIWTLKELIA